MTSPPPYDDTATGVEHATTAVNDQEPRYAIVDTFTGEIHGYVEPGNPPVAFTHPLKNSLKTILGDSNEIYQSNRAETPGGDHAETLQSIPPGETDEYLAYLARQIKLPFIIPGVNSQESVPKTGE